MDVYFANEETDEKGSCRIFFYFVRVLVLSLPHIADLVLSIISFDAELMTYFVLNYITIFFPC